MDLDAYQDEIGGISKYQVVVIFSAGLIAIAESMITQSAIFMNAVPKHRCALPLWDNSTFCNHTEDAILNKTIPLKDDGKGYSSCERFDFNFSDCTNTCEFTCIQDQDDVSTMNCDNGYAYDESVYGRTLASEFNLVCDRRYLDTIAQTLFFAGFFIGSALVGPLSDWFGRKRAVLISSLLMVFFSIISALSPSFEFYAVIRIFVGASAIAVYISMFIYACEISNTKWRTAAGVWAYTTSAISHTLHPAIAYLIKDWRNLQYVMAFLPIPFLLIYLCLPESPRWLLAKNKTKEARKVVSRYAKSNGKILTDEAWKKIVDSETQDKLESEKSKDAQQKITVWDLFRRPLMRIVCFNVMFSWFTVSMVFYGLALNGGNLAGDPYVNVTINSLVEIFGCLAVYFAYRFGRRPVLAASFIVAGLCCLISMLSFLNSHRISALLTASTAFAIMGKFFATLAFDIVYTVTGEIFPTIARSTGMSVGSMAARVGSMMSPLILEIQRNVPWFSSTVFGVLSILSGLMTFVYPETSTTDLISTLDEAEEYFRNNMAIARFFKKKPKEITEDLDNDDSEKDGLVAEY